MPVDIPVGVLKGLRDRTGQRYYSYIRLCGISWDMSVLSLQDLR